LFDGGYDIQDHMPEQIREHAEFLWRLGRPVLKDLASGRFSGRNHHIVFLARMTKMVTGREHYKELAELAECVRSAYDHGSNTEYSALSIRHMVDRYGPLDFGSRFELEQIAGKNDATKTRGTGDPRIES
jgi:hypothetical protein